MTNLDPASTGARDLAGGDLSRYRRHVDHLDLPEDRKAELLRAVYQIMQNFVDRAFGDDPAQLARKDGDETQLPRDRVSGMWYPLKITTAQEKQP